MDGTGRDPADGPGGDAPGADGGAAGGAAADDPVAGGSSGAPTIYDVARAAGVSIASVSRVLNGQRNPRQETRERVLAAVAELGFAPDGAARA
ncbi:MAG: LacI family DNA-binding transcriptional regulator, partial [Streptosporangiaceae bacterium]